jgi:hypothetical protein
MEQKRLEPWEELPEKSLKKVKAVTDAIHKATDNKEENLATDPIKVPGQNWACVSFVSPTGAQKCDFLGMKIRGIFDKHTEAVDYVKRLIKLDPTFDIFICSMYEWCLVPPDPEHVNDQNYQDEALNTLISEYRKNQIFAKEHFEERKRELVAQAADEVRRAALQKIQEESENELSDSLEKLNNDELHIRAESGAESLGVYEVTELESSNVDGENPNEVSASEIMDQMVYGKRND